MGMNRKCALRLTTSIALLLTLTKVCIGTYVLKQTHIIQKRDVNDAPTFINEDTWEDLSCGHFSLLKFGYRYLQENGQLSIDSNTNKFTPMLRQTYEVLTRQKDTLKRTLEDSLFNYSIAAFNLSNKFEADGLEAAVIYVYTTKFIYRKLNEALRLETTSDKDKRDEVLGTFALVLNAVLMYSNTLKSTDKETYRRMQLNVSDIAKYTENTKFVWIDFTSSSLNRSVADRFGGNVLFIFDNSEQTLWRPKEIYNFAYNPADKEALYPSGAMFIVTSVKIVSTNLTIINAKLIRQCSTFLLCNSRRKRDTGICSGQPENENPSSSHTASKGISLQKISYVACICIYFIFGSFVSMLNT